MSKEDKIKFIRQKCIEANPVDLGNGVCVSCDKSLCTCDKRTHDPEDGMGIIVEILKDFAK